MRRLLSVAVLSLLAFAGTAVAQDKPLYLGVTVGYNSFLNADASRSYDGFAAEAESPNWTDKGAVLGFEAGAYLSPELRLLLGGGFNRTYKPGHAATPGVSDALIPSYGETPDRIFMNYSAFVGGDFCINMGSSAKPFVGLRGRGTYGRNEVKYKFDAAAEIEHSSKAIAETWNIGGAVVFGADYVFNGGLIIGCQFDLFSYTYAAVQYKDQPGIKPNVGQCSSIGFIASPTLRVGFNF